MDNKEEEKIFAKEHRDYAHSFLMYSDDRLNKLSDSLATKLLQIATIIFAFSTAFLGKTIMVGVWIKIIFITGLSLLLASIVFGIIHEIIRIEFWAQWSEKRNRSFKAFNEAREGEIPYREARARHKEINVKDGLNKSKKWPSVVQSILLIIGTVGILISTSVYLFLN